MFKYFKNKKFSTPLFVTLSLAALILLPVFFIIFKSILGIENEKRAQVNYSVQNDGYDISDPFITKVPQLKDLLDGPIIDGNDPSLGNENAAITIVEFSDYECAFCENQEKVIKEVKEEYGDKIRLIWKDYPINNELTPSYQAAIAGRCAAEQDEFWAYHDILFEESHNLNATTFSEIAQELNLDLSIFKKCLKDVNIKKLVDNNIKEANALDINGIPFIYVNKQEVMGEISLDELRRIIDIELVKH